MASDRAAYRYLSETVDAYRTKEELLEMARRSGWKRQQLLRLTLGTVALMRGVARP